MCKNDDRCFYAAKGQVARPECQDVGIDLCRGIQKTRCINTSVDVGNVTIPCICVNKQFNPVKLNRKGLPKRCPRCMSKSQTPPPSPPPAPFIPGGVMTSEWGDYTPSTPNGTWTSMCSISAQARAIAYAADNANYAMAEGVWVGSWPALPEYGAPDLNKPDFSTNLYFEATQ